MELSIHRFHSVNRICKTNNDPLLFVWNWELLSFCFLNIFNFPFGKLPNDSLSLGKIEYIVVYSCLGHLLKTAQTSWFVREPEKELSQTRVLNNLWCEKNEKRKKLVRDTIT